MRRAWMNLALCAFLAGLTGCETVPWGPAPAAADQREASTSADPTEAQQQQQIGRAHV